MEESLVLNFTNTRVVQVAHIHKVTRLAPLLSSVPPSVVLLAKLDFGRDGNVLLELIRV